ncbi:uncharacterized protein LOC108681373 [Hyalella azteca]|uniref:Uncharacterized protein LOC108681373 n=1 Tax=Hyalella azteca TaxID=294128 RepID=A0A8B7PI91_HYAAZ|nr:uncharacterized protein LOC108681373 [Hyalella azteca]
MFSVLEVQHLTRRVDTMNAFRRLFTNGRRNEVAPAQLSSVSDLDENFAGPTEVCCEKTALINQQGQLCSVLKVRYVVTTIDHVPFLVPIESQAVNKWQLNHFIWANNTLTLHTSFPDGTLLNFDAVRASESSGYQILFMWIDSKPEEIPLPLNESALLLSCQLPASCQFQPSSESTCITLNKETHVLSTPTHYWSSGSYHPLDQLDSKDSLNIVVIEILEECDGIFKHSLLPLLSTDVSEHMKTLKSMQIIRIINGSVLPSKDHQCLVFDAHVKRDGCRWLYSHWGKETVLTTCYEFCSVLSHTDHVAHVLLCPGGGKSFACLIGGQPKLGTAVEGKFHPASESMPKYSIEYTPDVNANRSSTGLKIDSNAIESSTMHVAQVEVKALVTTSVENEASDSMDKTEAKVETVAANLIPDNFGGKEHVDTDSLQEECRDDDKKLTSEVIVASNSSGVTIWNTVITRTNESPVAENLFEMNDILIEHCEKSQVSHKAVLANDEERPVTVVALENVAAQVVSDDDDYRSIGYTSASEESQADYVDAFLDHDILTNKKTENVTAVTQEEISCIPVSADIKNLLLTDESLVSVLKSDDIVTNNEGNNRPMSDEDDSSEAADEEISLTIDSFAVTEEMAASPSLNPSSDEETKKLAASPSLDLLISDETKELTASSSFNRLSFDSENKGSSSSNQIVEAQTSCKEEGTEKCCAPPSTPGIETPINDTLGLHKELESDHLSSDLESIKIEIDPSATHTEFSSLLDLFRRIGDVIHSDSVVNCLDGIYEDLMKRCTPPICVGANFACDSGDTIYVAPNCREFRGYVVADDVFMVAHGTRHALVKCKLQNLYLVLPVDQFLTLPLMERISVLYSVASISLIAGVKVAYGLKAWNVDSPPVLLHHSCDMHNLCIGVSDGLSYLSTYSSVNQGVPLPACTRGTNIIPPLNQSLLAQLSFSVVPARIVAFQWKLLHVVVESFRESEHYSCQADVVFFQRVKRNMQRILEGQWINTNVFAVLLGNELMCVYDELPPNSCIHYCSEHRPTVLHSSEVVNINENLTDVPENRVSEALSPSPEVADDESDLSEFSADSTDIKEDVQDSSEIPFCSSTSSNSEADDADGYTEEKKLQTENSDLTCGSEVDNINLGQSQNVVTNSHQKVHLNQGGETKQTIKISVSPSQSTESYNVENAESVLQIENSEGKSAETPVGRASLRYVASVLCDDDSVITVKSSVLLSGLTGDNLDKNSKVQHQRSNLSVCRPPDCAEANLSLTKRADKVNVAGAGNSPNSCISPLSAAHSDDVRLQTALISTPKAKKKGAKNSLEHFVCPLQSENLRCNCAFLKAASCKIILPLMNLYDADCVLNELLSLPQNKFPLNTICVQLEKPLFLNARLITHVAVLAYRGNRPSCATAVTSQWCDREFLLHRELFEMLALYACDDRQELIVRGKIVMLVQGSGVLRFTIVPNGSVHYASFTSGSVRYATECMNGSSFVSLKDCFMETCLASIKLDKSKPPGSEFRFLSSKIMIGSVEQLEAKVSDISDMISLKHVLPQQVRKEEPPDCAHEISNIVWKKEIDQLVGKTIEMSSPASIPSDSARQFNSVFKNNGFLRLVDVAAEYAILACEDNSLVIMPHSNFLDALTYSAEKCYEMLNDCKGGILCGSLLSIRNPLKVGKYSVSHFALVVYGDTSHHADIRKAFETKRRPVATVEAKDVEELLKNLRVPVSERQNILVKATVLDATDCDGIMSFMDYQCRVQYAGVSLRNLSHNADEESTDNELGLQSLRALFGKTLDAIVVYRSWLLIKSYDTRELLVRTSKSTGSERVLHAPNQAQRCTEGHYEKATAEPGVSSKIPEAEVDERIVSKGISSTSTVSIAAFPTQNHSENNNSPETNNLLSSESAASNEVNTEQESVSDIQPARSVYKNTDQNKPLEVLNLTANNNLDIQETCRNAKATVPKFSAQKPTVAPESQAVATNACSVLAKNKNVTKSALSTNASSKSCSVDPREVVKMIFISSVDSALKNLEELNVDECLHGHKPNPTKLKHYVARIGEFFDDAVLFVTKVRNIILPYNKYYSKRPLEHALQTSCLSLMCINLPQMLRIGHIETNSFAFFAHFDKKPPCVKVLEQFLSMETNENLQKLAIEACLRISLVNSVPNKKLPKKALPASSQSSVQTPTPGKPRVLSPLPDSNISGRPPSKPKVKNSDSKSQTNSALVHVKSLNQNSNVNGTRNKKPSSTSQSSSPQHKGYASTGASMPNVFDQWLPASAKVRKSSSTNSLSKASSLNVTQHSVSAVTSPSKHKTGNNGDPQLKRTPVAADLHSRSNASTPKHKPNAGTNSPAKSKSIFPAKSRTAAVFLKTPCAGASETTIYDKSTTALAVSATKTNSDVFKHFSPPMNMKHSTPAAVPSSSASTESLSLLASLGTQQYSAAFSASKTLYSGVLKDVFSGFGRIETNEKALLMFKPKQCYLYGVSLDGLELWHVLIQGLSVRYSLRASDDMGSSLTVSRVYVGEADVSNTPLLILQQRICDWCEQNCVSASDTRLLISRTTQLKQDEAAE